ncbi:MAG: hypothetical protein HY245_13045 [Rhizobiales bacterium]|nr:hypothetical protein [Hyphomicrobiales bacterium]MBI3674316.1 hypothetical protein [Hyphomicrobiales bacterium]
MEFFKDYQPLIGASVALLAAIIGFSGVIYSQRRIAKVAEEGRAHQEKMAREQGERQRRAERESFHNAILGELSALQLGLASAIKILLAQISIAEELARQNPGRKTQPRVVFRFATPVFDSHVARIGLLQPELSFKVSNLFGQFKSFAAQAQDQVPEMDAALAVRIMRSVEGSLQKLQTETEELKTLLGGGVAA